MFSHIDPGVSQNSQAVPPVTENSLLDNEICSQPKKSLLSEAPNKDGFTAEGVSKHLTLSGKHRQKEEVHSSGSSSIDQLKRLSSTPSSLQPVHPIYPMVREADRLSGFIRRYEKKLESVCKSLLALASGIGKEEELLAAKQLDFPEMLKFIVEQDWYKAHSPDTNSLNLPLLVSSKVNCRNRGDSGGNNGYTITATGKLFLEMDGPVQSDVCLFLTYLDRMKVRLNRDDMLDHWKAMRLSGDVQSQRVCEKLDKFISFCVASCMIQN